MSFQKYRSTNFRPDTRARIVQINDILAEYDGQKLTARQVYYQCVSRGLLENTVNNYKNLTVLLTDARYARLVDWNIIEDRGRVPDSPSEWNSIDDLVETALRAFRLPRHRGQDNYVELWVEKQALAGVLQPIARKWHSTLMVNKGYSSCSAMKEAADRMREACFSSESYAAWREEWDTRLAEARDMAEEDGNSYIVSETEEAARDAFDELEDVRKPVVLYLGDHDPSGEDMVRDIRDRLSEFGVMGIVVKKVALNMDQIKKWNPPPNPAKLTDSRAASYIAKYGHHSWELDALPPRELTRLVEEAFAGVLDWKKIKLVMESEESEKDRLRNAMKKEK